MRLVGRKKIVWACINIDHAERVAKEIELHGDKVTCIHSKQIMEEQDEELSAFTNGDSRHLVFVSIVSTGFDYPPADAVVFLRPTRSSVRYIQTVGRALRRSPETGKIDALILDYGNVVKHCGPLDRPLVKDGARTVTADGEKITWSPRQCKNCGSFYFIEAFTPAPVACESCGGLFDKEKNASEKNLASRAMMEGKLYSEELTPQASVLVDARSRGEWLKVESVFIKKIIHPDGDRAGFFNELLLYYLCKTHDGHTVMHKQVVQSPYVCLGFDLESAWHAKGTLPIAPTMLPIACRFRHMSLVQKLKKSLSYFGFSKSLSVRKVIENTHGTSMPEFIRADSSLGDTLGSVLELKGAVPFRKMGPKDLEHCVDSESVLQVKMI